MHYRGGEGVIMHWVLCSAACSREGAGRGQGVMLCSLCTGWVWLCTVCRERPGCYAVTAAALGLGYLSWWRPDRAHSADNKSKIDKQFYIKLAMGNILGSLGVRIVDIVIWEVRCYPGKAMIPMMMNGGVESILERAFWCDVSIPSFQGSLQELVEFPLSIPRRVVPVVDIVVDRIQPLHGNTKVGPGPRSSHRQ